MTLDLDHLEALANAATPPPWTNDDNDRSGTDWLTWQGSVRSMAEYVSESIRAAMQELAQCATAAEEAFASEHRLRVEAEGAWGRWQRRAEAAEAAVAAVRALHPNSDGQCFECDDGHGVPVAWPCSTIRALDAQSGAASTAELPSGKVTRFTDEDSASGGE